MGALFKSPKACSRLKLRPPCADLWCAIPQAQAPVYHREDQMVPGNLGSAAPPFEGDWLTSIMDQALSVGLWGGYPSPEAMEQGKGQSPSSTPTPPNALLSGSPSGRLF